MSLLKEPIPGMSKNKSKSESLYLQHKGEWYEENQAENKRGRGGVIVFVDRFYYAMIPQELIRDPNAPHAAVRLFGVYHTYAHRENTKDLMKNPVTFASQERIAKDVGIHRTRVSFWTRYLEKEGWITVIRRGWNKSNIIILHGRKKRRR